MDVLKQFIASYFSTFGFVMMFNTPTNAIFQSSLVGAFGWAIMYILNIRMQSSMVSSFFAALSVGFIGEAFARHYKKPATIYIIPGIIQLVPGAGMYYTMLALIQNDFLEAAYKGTETLFIAASIAIGLIISTTLSRSIKRVKFKN